MDTVSVKYDLEKVNDGWVLYRTEMCGGGTICHEQRLDRLTANELAGELSHCQTELEGQHVLEKYFAHAAQGYKHVH